MKKTILKPAVAYYRRSTKNQEGSIEDQRKAVEAYAAKHGYKIIREYVDDSISGDDTDKRYAFLKMIADASKQDFEFILCWDQDRFGRFDSLDAGYYIKPLRDNGVKLATINQGVVDWESSIGRLTSSLTQEAKNAFLSDLSKNVCRGLSNSIVKGCSIGLPPYGYRFGGERKARKLELGPTNEQKVVKRIFREWVDGKSRTEIARGLDNDNIKPRRSNKWNPDSLKMILKNEVYIGTFVGGRNGYGSRNVITANGTRPPVKKGKREIKPLHEQIIMKDELPAIIDKRTFKAAQRRLEEARRAPRRPVDAYNYKLSGLVFCGKCGCSMIGEKTKSSAGHHNHYMLCSGKKKNKTSCEGTRIREDVLMKAIAVEIKTQLLCDMKLKDLAAMLDKAEKGKVTWASLPKPFKQLKEILRPDQPSFKVDKKKIAAEVRALEGRIGKANENLLEVDKKRIPILERQIDAMESELASLMESLETDLVTSLDLNNATFELLKSIFVLYGRFMGHGDKLEQAKVNGKKVGSGEAEENKFRRAIKRIVIRTAKTAGAKPEGNRNKPSHIEFELRKVGLDAVEVNSRLAD